MRSFFYGKPPMPAYGAYRANRPTIDGGDELSGERMMMPLRSGMMSLPPALLRIGHFTLKKWDQTLFSKRCHDRISTFKYCR